MDSSLIFAGFGLLAVLVMALVAVLALAAWVWAILDAVRRPDVEWQAAGHHKGLWLAVLVASWFVFVPFIAALVYAIWPRPSLDRARRAGGGMPAPTHVAPGQGQH